MGLRDFIETHHNDLLRQYPYVVDLCRLDQAWLEALNENGDAYLTLEAVQAIIDSGQDLSEMPICLVDSCQAVELNYDILALWGQLRFGEVAAGQPIELQLNSNRIRVSARR